jgi:hypothetical protein
LSLEDNYNENMKDTHQTILRRLNKKEDKGLVLLHGKPGTGKTSYIRYLLTRIRKKVFYLPPDMAETLTAPVLMDFLMQHTDSVLVIEDAENILTDRANSRSSAVSALLNLSDGLLSDCLNIQILCTFNVDISRIDSALLRQGRLIACHEFKALETTKAQSLSDKLGFRTRITQPMTLAEIYNQTETRYAPETARHIGFQRITAWPFLSIFKLSSHENHRTYFRDTLYTRFAARADSAIGLAQLVQYSFCPAGFDIEPCFQVRERTDFVCAGSGAGHHPVDAGRGLGVKTKTKLNHFNQAKP